jgi:hypothetical protein
LSTSPMLRATVSDVTTLALSFFASWHPSHWRPLRPFSSPSLVTHARPTRAGFATESCGKLPDFAPPLRKVSYRKRLRLALSSDHDFCRKSPRFGAALRYVSHRKHLRLLVVSHHDFCRTSARPAASAHNSSSFVRRASYSFAQTSARIHQPTSGSTANPINTCPTLPYPFPEGSAADCAACWC